MRALTLAFSKGASVLPSTRDGTSFRFRFTSVDSCFIGTPEEASKTRNHVLIVFVAGSNEATWKLSPEALLKVAFEIGKRSILEAASTGALQARHEVEVTTNTHPGKCPYDADRIGPPGKTIEEVVVRTKIGF